MRPSTTSSSVPSSTLALMWTSSLTFLTGALLAWVIPGYPSMFTIALVIPLILGQWLGERWMRRQVPRPRRVTPHGGWIMSSWS